METKVKCLIVDDEPLLTEMLSDYLKEQANGDSLEIETFPTGEACLEKLNEAPDLVILDYYLNSRERDAVSSSPGSKLQSPPLAHKAGRTGFPGPVFAQPVLQQAGFCKASTCGTVARRHSFYHRTALAGRRYGHAAF